MQTQAPDVAARLRDDDKKRGARWFGYAVLLACALLLGGCMHSIQADFVHHYTLGNAAPTHAPGQAPERGRKVLQISRIVVPSWLAGNAMYYRLEYRDDRSLATYAHSNWIAPPATLLESVIQDTIAARGNWRAVTGPGNPASADATLHLKLDDFSQAFSRLDDSAGVIDATATLIDNHDDSVVGQRHFHVEIVTPTPDAQGGAKALGEASRQFADELQRWLRRKTRR
jgi:cholesterol transport system auxiliary component